MRACYYGNVVRHDIILLELILSNEAQQFLFSFLYHFITCWTSPLGSRTPASGAGITAPPAPEDQIPNFLLACVSTSILIIIVQGTRGGR